MHVDSRIREAIDKHARDIENNDLVSVILEVYLQCGPKGVGELKDLFEKAGVEKEFFNGAVEKIITTLLKTALY